MRGPDEAGVEDESDGVDWGTDVVRVSVRVPVPLMDEYREAIEEGLFQNQSEAIRSSMRWHIRELRWRRQEREAE